MLSKYECEVSERPSVILRDSERERVTCPLQDGTNSMQRLTWLRKIGPGCRESERSRDRKRPGEFSEWKENIIKSRLWRWKQLKRSERMYSTEKCKTESDSSRDTHG